MANGEGLWGLECLWQGEGPSLDQGRLIAVPDQRAASSSTYSNVKPTLEVQTVQAVVVMGNHTDACPPVAPIYVRTSLCRTMRGCSWPCPNRDRESVTLPSRTVARKETALYPPFLGGIEPPTGRPHAGTHQNKKKRKSFVTIIHHNLAISMSTYSPMFMRLVHRCSSSVASLPACTADHLSLESLSPNFSSLKATAHFEKGEVVSSVQSIPAGK